MGTAAVPRKLCTNISKHIAWEEQELPLNIHQPRVNPSKKRIQHGQGNTHHGSSAPKIPNRLQHSAERVQFNIECNSHDGNYAPELPNIFQHTAQ